MLYIGAGNVESSDSSGEKERLSTPALPEQAEKENLKKRKWENQHKYMIG